MKCSLRHYTFQSLGVDTVNMNKHYAHPSASSVGNGLLARTALAKFAETTAFHGDRILAVESVSQVTVSRSEFTCPPSGLCYRQTK